MNAQDLLNLVEQEIQRATNGKPAYILDISDLKRILPKTGMKYATVATELGGTKISETEFMFEERYGPERMARQLLRNAKAANKQGGLFDRDLTKASLDVARRGMSRKVYYSPEALAISAAMPQTGNPNIDNTLAMIDRGIKEIKHSIEFNNHTKVTKRNHTAGYVINATGGNLPQLQRELQTLVRDFAVNDTIQSVQEIVSDAIKEALGDPKRSPTKPKSNKPTKARKEGKTQAKVALGISSAGRFTNNGRFISSASIMMVLNKLIYSYVRATMGRPQELNYRTGRFAKSVSIVGLTATREQAANVAYTYMLGPYETFEPGGRLGHMGLDPRRLITKAIRRLLLEVMKITSVVTTRV